MTKNIFRPVVLDDIPQIAAIHKKMFNTHFLGQYSEKVIEEFYNCFLGRPTFILSEIDHKIDGFVLGGFDSDLNTAKQRFLVENKLGYFVESLTKFNMYKEGLRRLWQLYVNHGSLPTPSRIKYRLLSIAVSPEALGTGIAVPLIEEFEKEIANYTGIYGLSVKMDNERAIRFYNKQGFMLEKTFQHSLYYTKEL